MFPEQDCIYKAVIESLPTGVYLVDRDRRIVLWNDGAERLTGYLRQEVIGRHCADNLLMHCNRNNAVLCGEACPLTQTIHDGQSREADVFLLHKEGQRVPVRVRAVPIRDEEGLVIGAAECFEARAILPAATARARGLEGEVPIDAATGLPDHAALEARLRAALEDFAESRVPFGVLDIAVDNLDPVLHADGRNAVNTVLYATGQTLSLSVGPGDMVGRWEDGRFLAVVTGCGAAALLRTAQQLKQLANLEAIPWWGDRLSVRLSAGGTVVRDGDTPESLVQRAEEARQTSGQTGDGNVVVT